jgi:hypothetical protein
MLNRNEILKQSREKGFTLLESMLVVGLVTLIGIGIVTALLEGVDTLGEITDAQNVEFGHQRTMNMFLSDVHSATMFFNDYVMQESGVEIPRDTTNPFFLIMGWEGPDGRQIWVRYKVRPGRFALDETYLMRTVLTSDGVDEGTEILATGVSNLGFMYYDDEGKFTDLIAEIDKIVMVLSLTSHGATVQREYDVALRNTNRGTVEPPGDFEDLEAPLFTK